MKVTSAWTKSQALDGILTAGLSSTYSAESKMALLKSAAELMFTAGRLAELEDQDAKFKEKK